MWLALCSGRQFLKRLVGACGDRILVTEEGKDSTRPGLEDLPASAVGLRGRVVGADWDQRWKGASAGLVLLAGKRSVVGGDNVVGKAGNTATLDDAANVEGFDRLAVMEPLLEGLIRAKVTGGEAGVGWDQPVETVRMIDEVANTNQSAPVLTKQRDMTEIECSDQGVHDVDVKLIGVGPAIGKFVRSAKTDEIRRNHAVSAGDEDRDHFAIQETP